ncbi:MAG: prepilin-type N-terminal cleavage/methylation domain-containing protein [Bacteroidota bacterium]
MREAAPPQRGELVTRGAADEGYTLLEISIVLFVLSLLGAGVMHGMAWAMHAHDRWEERIRVENTLHLIGRQIADDVQQAEGLTTSDTLWVAMHPHEIRHTYRLRSGQLWRNERPLVPERLQVTSMKVELEQGFAAVQTPLRGKSLERDAGPPVASIHLRLVGRYDSLHVRTSVAMRPSLRWAQ